ncbi:MAG: DNA-directed RNA polymerase subunit N [Conexivisphaerales archaeon]
MLIPVRCFTCGSLVGDKYEDFKARVETGEDPSKVLDSLGVKRYCCRRMLLSAFEIVDYEIPYYEAIERRRKELLGS